jgi:hypothetical protein
MADVRKLSIAELIDAHSAALRNKKLVDRRETLYKPRGIKT